MVWVFVFGGIALAGLVMLISYAVWLAHKTADVMSEVRVLSDRTGQLFELLAQIQPPESGGELRYRAGDDLEADLPFSGQVSEYSAT